MSLVVVERAPDGCAVFSPCERYRYRLERRFQPDPRGRVRRMTFVGLNPSSGSAFRNSPTLKRMIRFTLRWGYDRLILVNLYALRSPSPRALRSVDDPVGPENDRWLAEALLDADLVVACWGESAEPERVASVMSLVECEWWCLGLTRGGEPRHPLYVPASSQLVPFAGLS